MHLAPGTRLGPYEISASIGAGGMGEVYRAHDPRLGRSIAIKILLARHCADPERKLRFAQEARAASALNHPGIVTIYDVGSESGVDFIAMEFVEGKTLDSLIPKGGFPLREILRYATQAADAMAKAHAAGILHRDFKPANMIITESDQVKILDFGLAKLISKSSEERADETRATGTIAQIGAVTEEGRVMGTAAYMSPEQAEGTTLDSRSDIFSFGAVLYEMTTGQRAFEGGTAMSTIGSVLRDEPRSIRDRRREVPVELERLIRRCLRKDPGKRFQTMADLKVALEELKDESEFRTSRPFPPFKKRVFGLSAGVVVFFCALVLTGLRYGLHPLTPSNVSRPLPLTSYPGDERQPDFSPDGSQVAFVWNGEKQDNWDIYLKVVGSSGMPLRLTNDAASDSRPRWSPDGKAIAFIRSTADEDAIFLTSALGGTERRLAAFPTAIDSGLSWSPDSQWLAVTAGSRNGPTSLRLVSAESGESHTLTTPPPRFGGDFDPAFSPDGRSLAFVREHGMNVQELWILPLTKQGEIQREPKKILGDGKKNQAPAWSADGRDILFSAGELAFGGIFRMRADGSTPPVRVDALGDGVSEPALSWSSHRLAASHFYRTATIWRLDLESRGKQPEQFIASSSFRDAFPQYSPDGARIAFFSNRTGLNQIWTCNSDGTQPVQLTSMSGTTTGTPRWSPDGRWISFDSNSGGTWQIYVVNANGGRPAAVTGGDATNVVAGWSRDGKWIYFTSKRTGAEEVWKTPAPVRNAVPPPDEGTAAVQVTQHGGTSSLESFDGKTLYFTKTTPRFDFSLWKMPVGGGAETEVAPSLHRFNFSLTERSLFYATPSRRGSPAEIRRLDLATGKTVTLYTLTKRIDLGIGVSPDHRYLLFTQLDNVGSDLISVDHFQ